MRIESAITGQPEAENTKLGSSDGIENRRLGRRKHFHPENLQGKYWPPVDLDYGTVSYELKITINDGETQCIRCIAVLHLLPFAHSVTLDRDRFLTYAA